MSLKSVIGKNVKNLSKQVLILGVVLAVLGVICMIMPFEVGKTISVVLGLFFIVGGIIRLVFAFIGFTWGSAFFRFLFGILMIIAGIWLVMNPDAGLKVLTVWLGIYFMVDGVLAIIYSFQLRPVGGGSWMLLDGIMGIALAFMIWYQWPFSGDAALGILVGIKLLLDGGALISIGMVGRKLGGAVDENEVTPNT